jgi:hypothetical protein
MILSEHLLLLESARKSSLEPSLFLPFSPHPFLLAYTNLKTNFPKLSDMIR